MGSDTRAMGRLVNVVRGFSVSGRIGYVSYLYLTAHIQEMLILPVGKTKKAPPRGIG